MVTEGQLCEEELKGNVEAIGMKSLNLYQLRIPMGTMRLLGESDGNPNIFIKKKDMQN